MTCASASPTLQMHVSYAQAARATPLRLLSHCATPADTEPRRRTLYTAARDGTVVAPMEWVPAHARGLLFDFLMPPPPRKIEATGREQSVKRLQRGLGRGVLQWGGRPATLFSVFFN